MQKLTATILPSSRSVSSIFLGQQGLKFSAFLYEFRFSKSGVENAAKLL